MTESATNLRESFERLLELPAAERDVALQGIADPVVRERLSAMLAADARTGEALRDVTRLANAIGNELPVPLAPGVVIGGWTLDDWLGEGGSASVYRAHRLLDGARQVGALKLLRRGLGALEARLLFDRERRALLLLEHPDIARLIDGGVTPDGQGYLVLEYVDGQTITAHARQRRLNLRQRLQLMIGVANAVDAAHRALIVHRDLKPSNVMVNAGGQIKLLDFGIAKLLSSDAEHTQTAMRVFTPAYAAPEQRNGGPTTTATDVYALGVMLGELLTGRRFSDGDTTTPSLEIDEHTPEGTLPAPPAQLRRLIRGDLDNIVRKALANEPARRYQSAAVFADELQRVLDGKPVLAHPPSRWYRVGKFVRRNRASCALTATLSLALVGTLIYALQQAHAAQLEAARAQHQSGIAEITKNFALEIFSRSSPRTKSDQRLSIPEMIVSAADDVGQRFVGQPRVQVELYNELGRVLRQIGDHAAAIAVLSKGENAARSFDAIDPLRVVAEFELMRTYNAARQIDEARSRLDALMQLPDSAYPAQRFHRGTLLKIKMVALASQFQPQAALEAGRQALAIAEQRCAQLSSECETLGDTYNDVGAVSLGSGQYADGIALLRKAVAQKQQSQASQYSVANSMYFLGGGLAIVGDYSEALELFERSAEIAVAAEERLIRPQLVEWDWMRLRTELRDDRALELAESLWRRAQWPSLNCENLRLASSYRYAVAVARWRGASVNSQLLEAEAPDCDASATMSHRIAMAWQDLANGQRPAAAQLSDELSRFDFNSLTATQSSRQRLRSAALELSIALQAPASEIARYADHKTLLEERGVKPGSVEAFRADIAAVCAHRSDPAPMQQLQSRLSMFDAWPVREELARAFSHYCSANY